MSEFSDSESEEPTKHRFNFRRFRSKLHDHILVLFFADSSFPFIGRLEYSVLFGSCSVLGYKDDAVRCGMEKERRWTYICSTNLGCPLLCFNVTKPTSAPLNDDVEKILLEFCNKKIMERILQGKAEKQCCCVVVRNSKTHEVSMRYLTHIYPSILQCVDKKQKHSHLVSGAFALRRAGRRFVTLKTHHIATELCLNTIATTENQKNKQVVLVAGASNSGKSTFIRYLLNRALSSENVFQIYHLECDCGQSEFAIPGCLTLTKIDSPVFGDPFSHLRKSVKCYYFGHFSPENKLEEYLHMITNLKAQFDAIVDNERAILVVNTNGWVKGDGLGMLYKIIETTCPDDIFCFGGILMNQIRLNCTNFSTNVTMLENVNDTNDGISRVKNSALLRELSIASYFAKCFDFSRNFRVEYANNLTQITPFFAPWKDLVVEVIHGHVPPKHLFSVLNANVVALARCQNREHSHNQRWLNDEDYPFVVTESCLPVETFGFGIVRSIDTVLKHFYIITPVELEILKNVNVLLKGSVCLPAKLFLHESSSANLMCSPPFVANLSRNKGKKRLRLLHNLVTEKRQKF